MTNEVQQEVQRQLNRQVAKGIERYGHGIDHTDDSYDWLQEAIEECVDMLQYLCAAKLKYEKQREMLLRGFDISIHDEDVTISRYVDIEGELKFVMDDTQKPTPKMLHGLD
jgi:hypothetical protein